MLINASFSGMNLSNGVSLPSSSRMIPFNGVKLPSSLRMNLSNGVRLLPSSSRMILSNGVRLRSSSHPCKSIQALDYGLSKIIEGGVGHGFVNLNNRVRCLRQPSHCSKTNSNSSESFHGVSDADFFEFFESWCKKYGKTYSPEEEKLRRFNLFKDNFPFYAPDKSYLVLDLVNENAADDNNGSPHPLDFEDAISAYELHDICNHSDPPVPIRRSNYGICNIDLPFYVPPRGTTYLYNNGNPIIVYEVVTRPNKGIRFAVCKPLASKGITMVLMARDEKRGLEVVEKLKQLSLPDFVIFHQLDVIDYASIRSFVNSHNQLRKLNLLETEVANKVVDLSSSMEELANRWPKEVLSDAEKLTEEKIDEVLSKFLKDFKEGLLVDNKGWPIKSTSTTLSQNLL